MKPVQSVTHEAGRTPPRFVADKKSYVHFRGLDPAPTPALRGNITYDHLVAVVTANHLPAFNTRHATIFTGRGAKDPVTNKDDFQKWKESEVIQVCYAANLTGKEVNKVLVDSLNTRNSAAHPSGSQFNKLQAEQYISHLITNAMLKIT